MPAEVLEEKNHDQLKSEASIKLKRKNYLLLDNEELRERGIIGLRFKLAQLMRSKPVDIVLIALIVLYTVMVFFLIGIEDLSICADLLCDLFSYCELVILGIFVVEILLNTYAFRGLYYDDCWNIFDVLVIVLSIAFVIMDLTIENSTVRSVLKIRGIFRLLRIFILVRKLNVLRVKRDIRKRFATTLGINIQSPLEKVMFIL